MEPTLPELICVERRGNDTSITVDGQPFPYIVGRDDVHLSVDPDEIPSVTLTLYADRVEVINSLDADIKDRA
ncbi:hypothetical protein [Streptomyces sp. MP131-18]|uniref:hypothetical protein n=1 Tax=Streptomyces sp. MP131-18 TaxID=1857892 RepID=UPI00097BD2E5|nr:hypothetical protein [Streptomyces sp. MP131-18]ONK09435.1 hypothetical protein STBA_01350 [Streptomyces sp. MP131-18]